MAPSQPTQGSLRLPGRATFSGLSPRKSLVPVIGAPTRILFSLRKSRGNLEANRLHERTQIVGYALVQTVEFATLFFFQ
jgi:hypothetical protein